MSEPAGVRRVLVALDASPHSLAALQAAVEVAGTHRLELLALFVEDLRLLQATALPFAREVGTFSGIARPLGVPETERRLRHLAARLEARVAAAAGRAELASWSFQVRRGDVAAEILAALRPDDLLSVGAAGWSPMRARAVGETAQRLVQRARGPVLLVRHGHRLRLPVLVLLEGGAWRQTLATAATLAGRVPGGMVLALAPERNQAAREERAQSLLRHLGLPPARSRLLAGAGPAALRAAIRREGAGALLLPAEASALRDPGAALLAASDVPVIVVHSAEEAASGTLPDPEAHEESPLG